MSKNGKKDCNKHKKIFILVYIIGDEMIKKAIIPMAGKGTRLYPLTYSINKAILPFGNKTIIERQLDLLVNVGIEDVYLIVRPEDDIVSQVGYRYRGLTINYVIQKKPLGLADALQTVAKYLDDEKFLLLLCDVLFDEAIIRRLITCEKSSNKSKVIMMFWKSEELTASVILRTG